jgi:transposase InsO family protein
MGQHCSTQRHWPKFVSIEEGKLWHPHREIAADHIRWGLRIVSRLLRREGWSVNHIRVQRLWREEVLQRPISRKRKRARPPMDQCGVTGLSIRSRCEPWISSSMPRPTAAGSSS